MTKHIRIEQHSSGQFRTYHLTDDIATEQVCSLLVGASVNDPLKDHQSLSDDTKATLTAFYAIDGVHCVDIDINSVTIQRKTDHDWHPIEQAVIDTLTSLLDWTDKMVTIDYLFNHQIYLVPAPDQEVQQLLDQLRIKMATRATWGLTTHDGEF